MPSRKDYFESKWNMQTMLGVIELKKETRRRENYLTKERSRTRKSKERSC